jgi:hypothetical protein
MCQGEGLMVSDATKLVLAPIAADRYEERPIWSPGARRSIYGAVGSRARHRAAFIHAPCQSKLVT